MASSAARKRSAAEYGQPVQHSHKQPQMELLPENKSARRRAPARVPYGKYAVIFGCVFAVVMLVLSGYAQLTELTAQNTGLKEQLSELQSEENALNAKKEQFYNLGYVEQCAQDMGMVKQDSSQVTYVDLSSPERSLMAQEQEETPALLAGLAKTFNAVVEYLN